MTDAIVSMAIMLAVVTTLGAPPLAGMIIEIMLNAMAMFYHGNARLPPATQSRT